MPQTITFSKKDGGELDLDFPDNFSDDQIKFSIQSRRDRLAEWGVDIGNIPKPEQTGMLRQLPGSMAAAVYNDIPQALAQVGTAVKEHLLGAPSPPLADTQGNLIPGTETYPGGQLGQAAKAGLQGSVLGIAATQKVPDFQPIGAGERITQLLTGLAADLPPMVAGGALGAALGGGPAGAGAGMFALPAILKDAMIQDIQRGGDQRIQTQQALELAPPSSLNPNARDKREDNTLKGSGYFGPLKWLGDREGVASEISIGSGDVLEGKDVLIPSIVPTLTTEELKWLLTGGKITERSPMTERIWAKGVAHAKERLAQGRSVWIEEGEKPTPLPREGKGRGGPPQGLVESAGGLAEALYAGVKPATLGALLGATGKALEPVAQTLAPASKTAQALIKGAAEVPLFAAASSVPEGRLPGVADFEDAAAMVAAFGVSRAIADGLVARKAAEGKTATQAVEEIRKEIGAPGADVSGLPGVTQGKPETTPVTPPIVATDNIYIRMPIERVRQDAKHGVLAAQEALAAREAVPPVLEGTPRMPQETPAVPAGKPPTRPEIVQPGPTAPAPAPVAQVKEPQSNLELGQYNEIAREWGRPEIDANEWAMGDKVRPAIMSEMQRRSMPTQPQPTEVSPNAVQRKGQEEAPQVAPETLTAPRKEPTTPAVPETPLAPAPPQTTPARIGPKTPPGLISSMSDLSAPLPAVTPKTVGATTREAVLDDTNQAVKQFRERVREGGIRPLRGPMTTEDFGGAFPPGLFRRDAKTTWDQWGQEAVEMGLLDPDHTTNEFRDLLVGKNKNVRRYGEEREGAARKRYGDEYVDAQIETPAQVPETVETPERWGPPGLSREAEGIVGVYGSEVQAISALESQRKVLESEQSSTKTVDKLLVELRGETPGQEELFGETAIEARPRADLPGQRRFVGKPLGIVPPGATAIPDAIRDATDGMVRLVAPTLRRGGKETGAITSEEVSKAARAMDAFHEAMKPADTTFQRAAPQDNIDFMQRMDTGQAQSNPQLQATADSIRSLFEAKVKAVQALGTGKLEEVRDSYFPHIWKEKGATAQQAMGRRPWEGGKSFLRQRVYDDVQAGLDAGYTPVSTNPLDLVAIKMSEMDKYLIAHQTINALKGSGQIEFVRLGKKAPDGFTKINDRYSTVYAPKAEGGAGPQLVGHYYAADAAAQVINNYLSQSLYNNKYFGSPFRTYMGAANSLNQFQLGMFSMFHGGFVTMESVISEGALGIRQLSQGRLVPAMRSFVKAPVAPILNFRQGDRLIKEWLKPGSQGGDMAGIIDALMASGGKLHPWGRYTMETGHTRQMVQDWKAGGLTKKGAAVLRSPLVLAEQSARPIMEVLVPRIKFGVFGEMMNDWMAQNPGAGHEEMRASAREIWNRVDSRLGQVNYDRIFMNNAAKNVVQALVRAPGWTGGTILEVGGGGIDLAKVAADLVRFRKPEITNRAAYTISLLLTTALVNGALTTAFTGETPTDRDFWAFRTGRKDEYGKDERMMLPTYAKDLFAYWRSPLGTLGHKANPLISAGIDVVKNQDYYGNQIRDEFAPIMTQLAQVAGFVAKQYIPFWVRGAQRNVGAGEGIGGVIPPLVGIMPASKVLTQTKAEALLDEMRMGDRPVGGYSTEDTKRYQTIAALRRGHVRGNITSIRQAVETAEKAGVTLNRANLESIFSSGKKGTNADIERAGDRIRERTVPEMMQVWEAMMPEEKEVYRIPILQKIKRSETISEEDRKKAWTLVERKSP